MIGETRVYQLVNLDPSDRIHYLNTGYIMIDRIPRPTKPVLTKADFYRRFYAGEFGNHGPMWLDIESWERDGEQSPVMIRTRISSGINYTRVPREEVRGLFKSALHHMPTINLQCPEHEKTLTGEVYLSHRGLEFTGSDRVDTDQRRSTKLPDTIRLHGLQAVIVIRNRMCGSSWEWLNHLLREYPDHIVEFTTFRLNWGVIPGMNTIFWEVRRY